MSGDREWGITVYPDADASGYWRYVGAYRWTERRARLMARLASIVGLWVLGPCDEVADGGVDNLARVHRPPLRRRWHAIETADKDGDRYRAGRMVG